VSTTSGIIDVSAGPAEITTELPAVPDGLVPRPWWRRRARWVVAGLVIVFAGGGTGIWLATRSTSPVGIVTSTQIVTATIGTIKQTVNASGTIEPASQAALSFPVSGRVTAVNVVAGDRVVVGQVLATVDPSVLQAQLDAAQATLDSADAKLAADEANAASTTQLASDNASVASATSQLSSAKTARADASLVSTISGTVASVNLTVGQQLTGGSNANSSNSAPGANSTGSPAASSTGSSAQITVIGTDAYVVNATVDDTVIGELLKGDQATITPTGSTVVVYGTVGSIGVIASQSSSVATFPVTIDVTGNPGGLFPGATANVAIVVKQLNNVVEVPTGAISYAGGNPTVTAVIDGKDVVRAVTVGPSAAGQTQIVSGVSPGERVVEQIVRFVGGAPGGRGGTGLFGGGTGGLPGGGGGGGFPGGGFPGGGGFIGNGG
jgi:macrolide-specific efflux system membrane fusion protein